MSRFPKYLLKSLRSHRTSLGEHPSFPPDEELPFILHTVMKFFDKLNIEENEKELSAELQRLLIKCKSIEKGNTSALEQAALQIVNDIFNIPEGMVSIENSLSDNIDSSSQRQYPDEIDDFSFDSIKDMRSLTEEVYKRRLLNALIVGASLFYVMQPKRYIKYVFDINDELPSLYKKILVTNLKLIYLQNYSLSNKHIQDANKVDVYMNGDMNNVDIKSEAILFPLLIDADIRGLLELAISHSLPENMKKADYILRKSDFKAAEIWDIRLGLPLWQLVYEVFIECGCDPYDEQILSYVFLEFSQLGTAGFNKLFQEIFKKTVKGKEYIASLIHRIDNSRQKENFIKVLNDERLHFKNNSYFTPEELGTD